MNMKTCNQCYQPSFSSRKAGEWICPVCFADLTAVKLRDAEFVCKKSSVENQHNLQKRYCKQAQTDPDFSTYI
ncbi:hypothetical protein [Aquibacillus saliphilus]|uniref:hypothetical protein n=1 Tax=Aquibacillus saliphilus TaxID=1909422 RepID=UPI001CF01B04|nr:hypothetical protein [Aquibacillus saliphilus]